jgi:tRNA A-37 threonylcarbamoyl transferase component Bud32
MSLVVHIEPGLSRCFADAAAPERWLAALEPCRMERGKIQRGRLPDGTGVFLKRSDPQQGLAMWQSLLRGRWPASAARREWQLLGRLRAAGFATMEPLAWGEVRRFTLPEGSFLLVREVPGQEVADLFERSGGDARLELMRQVGELVGRLHAAGFFHPVRLKDLIQGEQGLVLIDRETSKPWPGWFTRGACLASLSRAARRTLRDGYRLHAGSALAFLRGYQAGVAPRWRPSLRTLIRQTTAALRAQWRGQKVKPRSALAAARA